MSHKKPSKKLSDRLLRKARSRGGKNGSRDAKVRAGKAGYQAMLRKQMEKEKLAIVDVVPVVSVSQTQDPNSFSTSTPAPITR